MTTIVDVILWSDQHPSPNHGPLANQNDVVLNGAAFSIGSAAGTLAPDALFIDVRIFVDATPMHIWGDHADSAGPLSRVTRRGSFVLRRFQK